MKRVIHVVISVGLVCLIIGCISEEPKNNDDELELSIVDASTKYGYFNFTIVNNEEVDYNISYKWKLNDPMAELPLFNGDGIIFVEAQDFEDISIYIQLNRTSEMYHDFEILVMYVDLYLDGELVYQFRGN